MVIYTCTLENFCVALKSFKNKLRFEVILFAQKTLLQIWRSLLMIKQFQKKLIKTTTLYFYFWTKMEPIIFMFATLKVVGIAHKCPNKTNFLIILKKNSDNIWMQKMAEIFSLVHQCLMEWIFFLASTR